MKKITLSDFTGGQNEALHPREFSNGQWHKLYGMLANDDSLPETQPAVQRIGSFPSGDYFHGVHAIVSSVGTYLVAITRLGRIYWCKAPDPDAPYTTANAITWTRITTAENYNWVSSGTPAKETILDNPYFRFICDVPVRAYQYARTPSPSLPRDTSKDTDVASEVGQFPGVLISYRTKEKSTVATPQVLIAYVNTKDSTPSVKALLFPNQRRIPTFTVGQIDGTETNDFINAVFLNNENQLDYATVPEWPFNMLSSSPAVRMFPFAYSNVDGANLSGTGIIPRATVGCSIEGKVVLGDIEWRQSGVTIPRLPTTLISVAEVGTSPTILEWPPNVEQTGRVIRNEGPSPLYLAANSDGLASSAPSSKGTPVSVLRARKVSTPAPNTCVITLKAPPPPGATSIVVSNVGPNYNGTFTSFSVSGNTVSYVNPKAPATIAEATRKGEVFFRSAGQGYSITVEPKGYAAVPNSWTFIAAVSDSVSEVYAYRDRLLARHLLNDANTGRVGNGVYFSIGDIDQFNPTAMFEISRGGAPIAGLHTIDNTVIAITEGGGETDGVYRIRGNLTLKSADDPTAVRVELVKGGVGAPLEPENRKNPSRRSCLWPDASTVIFVDRMGGVFFTDGNVCDRLDRLGPVTPVRTDFVSVAAVGKRLFVTRDAPTNTGRGFYCFSIVNSDGSAASGIWTQLSLERGLKATPPLYPGGPADPRPPGSRTYFFTFSLVDGGSSGTVFYYSDPSVLPVSLSGGSTDLFFVGIEGAEGQPTYQSDTAHSNITGASGGHIFRLALAGPDAERGKIDNENVVQYVISPTIGGDDDHDLTYWDRVGLTFTTESTCTIQNIYNLAEGGGYNNPSTDFMPFTFPVFPSAPQTFTAAANNVHEFQFRYNLGPQRVISVSAMFSGHVILQTLSAWTSGRFQHQGAPVSYGA
jgi:hypothetical protein